jgi:hypothetical protein
MEGWRSSISSRRGIAAAFTAKEAKEAMKMEKRVTAAEMKAVR